MALTGQTDRRTGTACEAEARWDPERKQSRYGRRRLVGHAGPRTGEVVPNRPTRASAPSPGPRRESCGACALPGAAAGESGVAAALGRALPHGSDQVPSLAHHVVCEGSAPLSRFPRYAATHATPHGAPIASQRSSELLASIGEAERDALCDSLARRHGEGDRLFYDTTSISSRSEALAQVRRGRDEDRVPLPQTSLAMPVGSRLVIKMLSEFVRHLPDFRLRVQSRHMDQIPRLIDHPDAVQECCVHPPRTIVV